jgi:hypothetical protein
MKDVKNYRINGNNPNCNDENLNDIRCETNKTFQEKKEGISEKNILMGLQETVKIRT